MKGYTQFEADAIIEAINEQRTAQNRAMEKASGNAPPMIENGDLID